MKLLDFTKKSSAPEMDPVLVHEDRYDEIAAATVRLFLTRGVLKRASMTDVEECVVLMGIGKQSRIFGESILQKLDSALRAMARQNPPRPSPACGDMMDKLLLANYSLVLPEPKVWQDIFAGVKTFIQSSRSGTTQDECLALTNLVARSEPGFYASMAFYNDGVPLGEQNYTSPWLKLSAPAWGSPDYSWFVNSLLTSYASDGKIRDIAMSNFCTNLNTSSAGRRLTEEERQDLRSKASRVSSLGVSNIDWFYKKEGPI